MGAACCGERMDEEAELLLPFAPENQSPLDDDVRCSLFVDNNLYQDIFSMMDIGIYPTIIFSYSFIPTNFPLAYMPISSPLPPILFPTPHFVAFLLLLLLCRIKSCLLI